MKRNRILFAAAAAAIALSGMGGGLGGSPVLAATHAAANSEAQDQSRDESDDARREPRAGNDQGDARREMRAGNQLSLREIERRILPQMGGSEYLGPSYDSTVRAYRLKFIRDGRVTYIDVDARTGRIISRAN